MCNYGWPEVGVAGRTGILLESSGSWVEEGLQGVQMGNRLVQSRENKNSGEASEMDPVGSVILFYIL